MFHGIQQLILVDEMANHEICQASKQNHPRIFEDAVNYADDEYQDSLWQEETVAEDGWLN